MSQHELVLFPANRFHNDNMNNSIYEKTDKGREEIATRKYQLPPKLRSLLVMIDGVQSADKLLQRVASLGLGEQSLSELLEQDFIRSKNDPAD